MSRFAFWKTPPTEPEKAEVTHPSVEIAPRAEGFRAPPPRHSQSADQLTPAMIKRNELIDAITQIEHTVADTVYWTERVTPIQQALENVEVDLRSLQQIDRSKPIAVPSFPVTIFEVEAGPPARVSLRIGDRAIDFEEEIDWSERGHQIVRPDLEREPGIPLGIAAIDGQDIESAFDAGLFALATDLRQLQATMPLTPSVIEECRGGDRW